MDGDGGFGVVPWVPRFGDDLIGYIHAFDDFAEGGVLTVEEGGFGDADKELTAAGITFGVAFISESGGGDGAPLVLIADFRGDGVTRAASAVGATIVGVFTFGIATLDHESWDDAVKGGAVVKSVFDEFFKVFAVFGAFDDIEFDHDDAIGGGDGDDIFFNEGGFHVGGFLWGGGVGFRRARGKSEKKREGEWSDDFCGDDRFKHVEEWSKLLRRPIPNFQLQRDLA